MLLMDYLALLRQYRIGPFPIFDIILAYAGIFILSPLLTKLFAKVHLNISRSSWLWLTLPLSIVFHLIFRQNTPLMKMLLDPSRFYIPVVILLFMMYMGLRNIHKP